MDGRTASLHGAFSWLHADCRHLCLWCKLPFSWPNSGGRSLNLSHGADVVDSNVGLFNWWTNTSIYGHIGSCSHKYENSGTNSVKFGTCQLGAQEKPRPCRRPLPGIAPRQITLRPLAQSRFLHPPPASLVILVKVTAHCSRLALGVFHTGVSQLLIDLHFETGDPAYLLTRFYHYHTREVIYILTHCY